MKDKTYYSLFGVAVLVSAAAEDEVYKRLGRLLLGIEGV